MNFKGSGTEKNLKAAFAGESQAALKYQFFALKAREEGYEKVAGILEEISNQEKAHAKVWFKIFRASLSCTSLLKLDTLARTL